MAVGVGVALLDEFGHRALAIGRFVVRAGEIERADRDCDRDESRRRRRTAPWPRQRRHGAPTSRSSERTRPRGRADARRARAHRVRHGRLRRRTHQNDLLDANRREFFDESHRQLGPIADAMPLATPEASDGNWITIGSRHDRQPHRAEQQSARRGPGAVPSDRGLRPRADRPRPARLECRARRRRQHRADEIAPAVEVVHGEDDFAKPGLAEVVGEQIDVAPADLRRGRLRLRSTRRARAARACRRAWRPARSASSGAPNRRHQNAPVNAPPRSLLPRRPHRRRHEHAGDDQHAEHRARGQDRRTGSAD